MVLPKIGLTDETVPINYRSREGERSVRVPKRLLRVPGIQRSPREERFYANEYPMPDFMKVHHAWHKHDAMQNIQMYTGPLGQTLRKLFRACTYSHLRKPKRTPEGSADPTELLRQKAYQLGFRIVGFALYDSRYIYNGNHDGVRFSNVIVLGQETDYEPTQMIPSPKNQLAIGETLERWTNGALAVADFLLSQGYRAQVDNPMKTVGLVQPYAVAAGLGQMGANGQLLTPEVGSRIRLGLIFTDAPIRPDEPKDFGIPNLCAECQVCVNRCPGRALTSKEINWRGVLKYKTIAHRCMPIHSRYNGCGICMKVCPVQKYGLEAVMEHYIASSGQILGKGTHELEGYDLPDKGHFGPGERPIYTLRELVTPGVKAPRPLGKKTIAEIRLPESVEY